MYLFKKQCLWFLIFIFLASPVVWGQSEIINFDSDRWELQQGSKVEEYLNQKSLVGNATLKDVEFENGIIEVDVAFEGARYFAGINFRMQSAKNYEHFYLRPHKSNLPDAIQYTPVFNGTSS